MRWFVFVLSLLGLNSSPDKNDLPLHRRDSLIDAIIANIDLPDGLPGLPIASPSKQSPDYYYHWVRDGALSIGALIDNWVTTGDARLTRIINDYATTASKLQHTDLGEPKFFVDGTVYNGPWGRPQNDGPALRALVLSKWAAMSRVHQGDVAFVASLYSKVIRNDALYVSDVWREPSFDLWEEQYGYHFFTGMMQWGALKSAAILAETIGAESDAAHFRASRDSLGSFILEHFVDDTICEHWPCGSRGRSGLDAATLLAVLELDDLAGWTSVVDSIPLLVNTTTPAILSTVQGLRDAGSHLYEVAGGIGRYPEDIYDGVGQSRGNPWFICTAAAAEILMRADEMDAASDHLRFIGTHRAHDGTISEQADAITGFMRGAQNLSWSYSSLYRARKTALAAGRPDLVRLTEPFYS